MATLSEQLLKQAAFPNGRCSATFRMLGFLLIGLSLAVLVSLVPRSGQHQVLQETATTFAWQPTRPARIRHFQQPAMVHQRMQPIVARALHEVEKVSAECGCPVKTAPKIDDPKKALGAAMLSAMLMVSPAHADLNSAVKDLTDAAYPIVGSLQADKVGPLTSNAVGVLLTADPKDIIKTVDTGLDAFLSTPPEKFIATVKELKKATGEASASGGKCNLVCLPSLETAEKVAAVAGDALGAADKDKVAAFAGQAVKTFNSVNKLKLAPLLVDGGKFAASLNPGDVAKSTAALVEVVKESSR